MKYKMMKVFDCQDMPDDVKDAFFALYGNSNDCYVDFYLQKFTLTKDANEYCKNSQLVENWLVENGGDGKEGDSVIIKHWW